MKNNIYIPAVNDKGAISFQIQVLFFTEVCNNSELIITGNITFELEQAVLIAITNLKKEKINIPNYLHVHFPDYSILKSGISSSLGIYFTLKNFLTNFYFFSKEKTLITGELDIEGNILEVGGIEEKIEYFVNSDYEYSILPFSNKKKIEKILNKDKILNKKIIFMKNINEIQVMYNENK